MLRILTPVCLQMIAQLNPQNVPNEYIFTKLVEAEENVIKTLWQLTQTLAKTFVKLKHGIGRANVRLSAILSLHTIEPLIQSWSLYSPLTHLDGL